MAKSKKNNENLAKETSGDDENSRNDDASTKDQNSENDSIEKNKEEELLEEVKNLKDQLLRSLAENENLRKRTSKDIEQIKKYGHISFVRELLSSVDNLHRAVSASNFDKNKLDEGVQNLIKGVEIVLNEINNIFDKNFIKKIEPIHENFDYNLHQAMYEAPSDEHGDGVITEVIQAGYVLHDRLIRPAMVGVSKGKNIEINKKEQDSE